jgi:hypothetical protein
MTEKQKEAFKSIEFEESAKFKMPINDLQLSKAKRYTSDEVYVLIDSKLDELVPYSFKYMGHRYFVYILEVDI